MEYKCVKEIQLEKYDEHCFPTGEYYFVPIGSTWMREDDSNLLGGEAHLECIDGADDFGWIEVTEEDLRQHFEVVEDE